MSNNPPGRTSALSDALLAKGAWITLGTAGLLTATWLWCCWCSFPGIPWNDIRVAPAVALHQGISVYSTATTGPVSTWTYGPLPLLLLWPAGLSSSAIGALETAGALHIGLTVLTLLATCLFWPAAAASEAPAQVRLIRLECALLCVLLVRNDTSGYTVYCADAPGIVFGLLALLAVVHRQPWPAALCAAAAVACKQTLLGVALAQFVWLYLAVSPRAAWRHLGRCVLAGAVVAVAAIGYFGVPGLWYVLIGLPGQFPWAPPLARISDHAVYLLLHVVLPIAVMLAGRRFFFGRKSPGLLPAIAFFCTLPFSLAGFFKNGGNVNSLHSFWLWFPPALVLVTTGKPFARLGRLGSLALATLALILASLWLQISHLPVRPNIQAYREANYLAARMPGKIWFPLHPLVTLYSEGRLYHDLDGLCVRRIVGQRLSDEHFFAHLPRERQASATLLPVGWGLAEIGDARQPLDTPVRSFGLWRIDGYLE